ncbi:MAG: UDP-N-acetylglucosamine 2-epimerase (non-hydrolyzing) [Pseudomonadota bacterium]
MTARALLVFGTRPEAIKMLPVVDALKAAPGIEPHVCVTAQHRDLLDGVLDLFDVKPNFDLNIMKTGQDLTEVTGAVLSGVADILSKHRYDWVVVHGDTTTTMASALAAFYQKVPVAHVEAGLRSGDISQPWPEEANRRFTDMISTLHFAPTSSARENLLGEAVPPSSITVTGNTAIDALQTTLAKLDAQPAHRAALDQAFAFLDGSPTPSTSSGGGSSPIILVTAHRRENFGAPFRAICKAIRDLAEEDGAQIVYPVHPNPNVQAVAHEMLASVENVHLVPPIDYAAFVYLMRRADIIMTDSGGVQEEAPSLGKPVFVMRNVTERPEAVDAGAARLVGTQRESIVNAVREVIRDRSAYERMRASSNPFGDGKAAQRIASVLSVGRTDEFC